MTELGFPIAPRPNFRWIAEQVWSIEHAFERARIAGHAERGAERRLRWLIVIFAALYALLCGVACLRALSGAPREAGVAAYDPVDQVSRADLVDRNGLLLAAEVPHYKLFVDAKDMPGADRDGVKAALIAALPDVGVGAINRAFECSAKTVQAPVTLWERVMAKLSHAPAPAAQGPCIAAMDLDAAAKARVHALGLPGVSFSEVGHRDYPLGRQAAHVIGYLGSDPHINGGVETGMAGAEKDFDADIRQAAKTGEPISLSLDVRVQGALQDEVRAAALDQQALGAIGIVTNIRTGEVLGMASWPDYDPNDPESAPAAGLPKLNRVIGQAFEMGSTFKTFTLATGFDTGKVTPDTIIDCRVPVRIDAKRVIHDHSAQARPMTVEEVFTTSSNIGATHIALDHIGAADMVRYFRAFGLKPPPGKITTGVLASMSFGHNITATPAAVAAGVGAIMNGGVYVPLTLKKFSGQTPPDGPRVVKESTSRTMLDMMRANVDFSRWKTLRNSGFRADIPGYSVGGKTGSAEKPSKGGISRNHLVSSFVSVFPTDGDFSTPRYLVYILIDDPKGSKASRFERLGGAVAAPAVGRVIERIAPFLGVPRKLETPAPVATQQAAAAAQAPTTPEEDDSGEDPQ